MMKTRLEWRYPWLDDRSAWQETLERQHPRPDWVGTGDGCWVLGNGHVFAARHAPPFTRLGHLLGPTYQRDRDFPGWGDQEILVQLYGQTVIWDRQTAFRIRRTGIIGAELIYDSLRLLVIDFAPPEWPVIVRLLLAQNSGSRIIDGVSTYLLHEKLPPGEYRQRVDGWEYAASGRRLRVTLPDGASEVGERWLRRDLPVLVPGEDELFPLLILTGTDDNELDVLTAKAARDPEGLLGMTYHWWQSWMQDTLAVTGDNHRLGDLVDDAKVLVAVQQGESGAIAPLTARSSSTATEELDPTSFLLRIGKFDEARRALEGRYRESVRLERYAAMLPMDPAPLTIPSPPRWEAAPPPAWTAAAIVRQHWQYWKQTGDDELIRRHFDYLCHLVEGQPLSVDNLAAFGGDEPFYSTFQHRLPRDLRQSLLADPEPVHLMRPAPWGAAPSMALAAAAEFLSVMARPLGLESDAHRLGALGERIREAVERTFWLPDEEYYAAARSRVDGHLFRAPHLPTALAPFTTGYALAEEERARRGLDETLQYLLSETGLPLTAPETPAFPGTLPGELLSALVWSNDPRLDIIFQAALSCASPAGEFRPLYLLAEGPTPRSGLACPSDTAANLLGILDYFLYPHPADECVEIITHLPPASEHLRLEGYRLESRRVEAVLTDHLGQRRVHLGNAGPGELRVRLREEVASSTAAYLLLPGVHRQWELPIPVGASGLLPAPRSYQPSPDRLPAAPALILTVDSESFTDWRDTYRAIIVDAAMPLLPETIARALAEDHCRRYDVLYLDVPEHDAAWTGLPAHFWDDASLQQALQQFRDLGGIVTGTLFVDSWLVHIPDQTPVEFASRSGWIALPPTDTVVIATGIVPWEAAKDEVVELLLYVADGADLELTVNGSPVWRRESRPEGQRVRLDVVLHPGDNTFVLHARRRHGHGFGFSLGIRGELRWNEQRGQAKRGRPRAA